MRPNKDDVGETEELFRKFQAILNKLTPQKFQNLAEQALQLKIDSEERLKGCIDKIFTKVSKREKEKSREKEREREGGREGRVPHRMKPSALENFLYSIHLSLSQALEEPKFSIAYANLCKVMSTIKVEVPAEPEGKPKVITFRRVLLTKCQQEFEKDKKDDEEREKMLNAIKETEDVSKSKSDKAFRV